MSQTVFQYNDFSAEYDVFDADSAAAFETAMDKMREAEKAMPKDGKISTLVRAQCGMLRDFFDDVFGAGSGVKICGEKDTFSNCKNAYMTFLGFVDAQKADYLNDVNETRNKYSANRAQRRHPTAPNGKNG